MQISSTPSFDIATKYTIKLNDKEMLIVEEDPLSKAQSDSIKAQKKREKETQETQKEKTSETQSELTQGEQQLVQDLATRDSEVRAHEAAHQAAGGGMTGAASYTYQQGPDGKMYAIGGEVSIAMPSGSTPEETIKNARQVAAAAMAAGNPSPQDFAVASSARMMEMQAQQQKTKEIQEQQNGQATYLSQTRQPSSNSQKIMPSLDVSA